MRLVSAVAAAITAPKQRPPSSIVLHAPLELLARAALLPRVAPSARDLARQQIAAIASRYAAEGPEITLLSPTFATPRHAQEALLAALRNGDADGCNGALEFLLKALPLWQLRAALVDVLTPQLGAAAHTPILLAALPRFVHTIPGLGGLLHAPLRSVARQADLQLTWHTQPGPEGGTDADPASILWQRLAQVPAWALASTAIAPTLLAVQNNGMATRLLAGPCQTLTVPQAQRVLLRLAALSMLQDTPQHAPYGWTHCLSLPQAVLANADASRDPQALVAIAATHVLAFRATLGTVALEVSDVIADPQISATALASHAATHPDAHLAKYTLACLDAADNDPQAAPLFLAAAAHLGRWWKTQDASHSLGMRS
ncbi:hypothetical protein J2X19_001924 [Rhodoferax ferrireducens]|uniref:Uncharacterized protein n=1 Tax=Rhodoferax ferrireducens TaxID=192843 RepID=A0ABU2C7C2_9BURK|nr:hypothetical protein [Rhodoferax ferrireducens]MDR7377245.1 hypothetical protein [Rhodoferax ferrireducens]